MFKQSNELNIKKRLFKVNWTQEEENILFSMASPDKKNYWKSISILLNNKTPSQCFYRFHSSKAHVNKKKWNLEEDKIVKDFVKSHGKKWEEIAKLLNLRSSKQIKQRYVNKLDENLIRSKFNEEEDEKIISFFMKYGSKWSFISKSFQGRTPEMLKSRFYSALQKRIIFNNCQNNNNNYQMELSKEKVNILFIILLIKQILQNK
jgi:myb proto-oncogene protein